MILKIDPELVASNEDGDEWYRRDVSRLLLLLHVVREYDYKLRYVRVRAGFMRPVTEEDCRREHPRGGEEGYDHAPWQCYWIEEGWHRCCEPTHPDAIPVWKVWCECHLLPYRYVHWRTRLGYKLTASRHVLWGGRVERRGNLWDRVLRGHWIFNRPGDFWPVTLTLRAQWDRERGERMERNRQEFLARMQAQR